MNCQETAGFLFNHPCSRDSVRTCATCDKGICQRHTKAVAGAEMCVTCAKIELEKQQQTQGTAKARGRGSRYREDRVYGDYDDDPYFYGSSYYTGYGSYRRGYWGHSYYSSTRHDYDRNDFSEADAQSFGAEADDMAFEQDMGAS